MKWQAIVGAALTLGLAVASSLGSADELPEAFRLPVPLTVREIALETRDIAYDAHSGRIFASSGATTRGRANSITALNPRTGAMEPPVFIGSEPGRLAVSPDGSNLYVVLEGAAAIARFDIRSRKPVHRFDIRSPHLDDMIVPAGHPNWVVIARQRPGISPRHAGGSLYVDGKETALYQWGPNIFIPAPDGDRLYGVYNEHRADRITRRSLGLKGTGEAQPFSSSEDEGTQFAVEEGKVFSNSGRIYDLESGELLGRCGTGGQFVAVQERNHRAYYLRSVDKGYRFQVYDTRTFVPGDWLDFSGVKGRITRLVKYGADSYAFRTDAGQLFLIRPTAETAPANEIPASPIPGATLPTAKTPGAKPERGAPFSNVAGASNRPQFEVAWGEVNEVIGEPGKGGGPSRLSAMLLLRNTYDEAATPRCGVRIFLTDRGTLTGKEVPLQRTLVPPIRSFETFAVTLAVELPAGTNTSGKFLVASLDRPVFDREAGQTRTQVVVGPLP